MLSEIVDIMKQFVQYFKMQRELGLLLTFIAAVLIRFASLYCEPVLSRDGIGYVQLASGENFEPTRFLLCPLLHVVLKFFYSLGYDVYICGIVFNVIIGSLIPVIVFFIAFPGRIPYNQ